MRILQVTPGYYPDFGGVEYHVQAISEALVESGHEVSVAAPSQKNGLPSVERVGKVVVRRFPAIGPRAYRFPIGLYHYLRAEGLRFDVIHAHNYGAIPLLLAALTGWKRVVITPHYHGRGRSRVADILHRVYDPVAIPILQRVSSVICVSTGEAELVADRLGIARDRIVVIPNAITLRGMDVRHLCEITNKDNLILCVGRLDAYKRVDRVINSLPHLPKEFTLVVIGSGPEEAALKQIVKSLDVENRVRFLGYVSDDDLQSWYARSRVVVSLSEGEAFGRVVIEALAFGCRVVCNDIPAFRDFFLKFPEEVSLVASSAEYEDVAEAIRSAADKPVCSVDLQDYTSARIAEQLSNIYSTVIK